MHCFEELNSHEVLIIDGGGIISSLAGGLAGGMIGAVVGLIPAAVTGDVSYITKTATAVGAVGVWVGAGAPLP